MLITGGKRAQLLIASVLVFALVGPIAGPQIAIFVYAYYFGIVPAVIAGLLFGGVLAALPDRAFVVVHSSPWKTGLPSLVGLGLLCGYVADVIYWNFLIDMDSGRTPFKFGMSPFGQISLLSGGVCAAVMLLVGRWLLRNRLRRQGTSE